MVYKKIQTDASILSVGTGDSVTPERVIPRKKMSMKSPVIPPPRKDPITNQYINRLITEKIRVFHHI